MLQDNQTSLKNEIVISANEIKQTASNLSNVQLSEISDNSVVAAENFEIKINESASILNDSKTLLLHTGNQILVSEKLLP